MHNVTCWRKMTDIKILMNDHCLNFGLALKVKTLNTSPGKPWLFINSCILQEFCVE